MSKNENLTVTEAALLIQDKAESWDPNGKVSIYKVTRDRARKLSKDAIFNAAAWMKYAFGACLHGESDADWIQSAKDLSKIL